MLNSIFTRTRSDHKWCIRHNWFGAALSSLACLDIEKRLRSHEADVTSQDFVHYLYSEGSDEIDQLFPAVLTCESRTHHATVMRMNPNHSFLILLVRRKCYAADSSRKQLLSGTNSQQDVFPIFAIFTSSRLGLTIIFPTWPHKQHFVIYTPTIL